MKTRLRRWYWSAIRPGGLPLEYVGDPFEKLLGFLVAVVILAFYIGIVNLLLMFLSFSLFQGNTYAYAVSLIGVIPLWFYARYRARRYVLARTRWRGIRFGLAPGAWGFALRSLVYWALMICTAGLLLPLMTFKLEKYKTDRTFFGSAALKQGGRWTALYQPMLPMFFALFLAIGAAAAGFEGNISGATTLGIVAGIVLAYGLIHYRVRSLQYLTSNKTLGDTGLRLEPSVLRVLWISLSGYTLAGLASAIPLTLIALAAFAMLPSSVIEDIPVGDFMENPFSSGGVGTIVLMTALYFATFLIWSTMVHIFVTMPSFRHYATSLTILQPAALDKLHQRPRDEFAEAEGFAEALDVGASL